VAGSTHSRGGNGQAKTSIYDHFVTDDKLQADGVWFVHPVSGMRFKIAMADNDVHAALLDELGEARLRQFENEQLPREEIAAQSAKLIGIGLLRDWDERFAEPFSTDEAVALLRKARHLRLWIGARANEYQHYLGVQRAADLKN
jgi:hypothetical protein